MSRPEIPGHTNTPNKGVTVNRKRYIRKGPLINAHKVVTYF